MMKVRKDLLKFVMLERAAAIISLSWIRGLIFFIVTHCIPTIMLLKNQALIQIFRHYFRDFLTLISAFVRGRSMGVSGTLEWAIVIVMN